MCRSSLLPLLFVGACAAPPPPALPDGFHVAPDVAPHVRDAFARAVARLPAPLAEELEGVTLIERELALPEGAPLSARLVARGALAYYSIQERQVAVTAGGASGRPTWTGAAPKREQLDAFLVGAFPDLGPQDRWPTFVARVGEWTALPPAPHPPGDPRLLDRFVALAGQRALGGDWPLEQLVFHELMHGVQLRWDDMEMRLQAWCGLAGWLEADSGRVSDGSHGGVYQTEHPEVLVRLVLGGERRGGAFEHDRAFRACNLYTAYDPREDYADSARLMAYDPARLAEVAPEKFLYLNALGWCARRDHLQPGPRWYGPAELGAARFERTVREGARALWRRAELLDGVPPRALAAVLGAHGPWLDPAQLPRLAVTPAPPDLPPGVAGTPDLTFAVADGSRRALPARVWTGVWDEGLYSWNLAHEVGRGLIGWFELSPEELAERERETQLVVEDPAARAEAAYGLLLEAQGVWSAARVRRVLASEARFQEERARPLAAELLRLRFGHDPLATRIARARARLENRSAVSFEAVELAHAVAALLRREGAPQALEAALAIPGTTWGASRRVDALLLLGEHVAAREAAQSASLPRLRADLLARVAREGE